MGTRQELLDLLTFVTNAGIVPEIGLEAPMADAKEAFRAMEHGKTAGKIALTR
ncbi:zinc-binding dehydrogenase [Streptomyces sp. NA02950]|nr:zinc-binding dehydrogenase [Streptomyces sp. NA02950]QKV90488.1 zinc-binding dehydrogenase [Streptomyces sp. NA02950]